MENSNGQQIPIEELREDLKHIAVAVYKILDTLKLINNKGELEIQGRSAARSIGNIVSSMMAGKGLKQFDFLQDSFPLLAKYQFLIDEALRDEQEEESRR